MPKLRGRVNILEAQLCRRNKIILVGIHLLMGHWTKI